MEIESLERTILLVEDDDGMRVLMGRRLRRAGFLLASVSSGERARDWLRSSEAALMILDYQLTDCTGAELVAWIEAEGLSLPFIVTTGHGDERLAVKMMKLGAQDYLVKDQSLLKLLPSVVTRVMEQLRRDELLARAEADKLELEAQVRHAQKLEGLGVLAGGVAHDFNNILTAILGNADLAQLSIDSDSPAREPLDDIIRASQRATDLCQQMLAYAGQGSLAFKPVDFDQLIRDMGTLVSVANAHKVQLEMVLSTSLPAVTGDAGQLSQVVLNLITNASEAIGEAGGTIRVTTGVTEWAGPKAGHLYAGAELSRGRRCIFFEVVDDGCGMNEEMQARIFDPFYSTKFTGRGLGLAAVQGVMRAHDGLIDVESRPGEGSRFRVVLPCLQDAPAQELEPLPTPSAWHGAGHVLVVDDEKTVVNVASRMLERLGHSVLTAPDGAAGVALYRERQEDIVAVLLDMTMPKMSGEEALRRMREIRPDLSVILSSGYDERALDRPDDSGTQFLKKPYQLAELGAALRALISE